MINEVKQNQIIFFTTLSILSIYLNSFIKSSFLCFYCCSFLSITPLNLFI